MPAEPLQIKPADSAEQPFPAGWAEPAWCKLVTGPVRILDLTPVENAVNVTLLNVSADGKTTHHTPGIIPAGRTEAVAAARQALTSDTTLTLAAVATRTADADQQVPYDEVPTGFRWLRVDSLTVPATVDPRVADALRDVEQAWAMRQPKEECDRAARAAKTKGATPEQVEAAAESGVGTWTDMPADGEPIPAGDDLPPPDPEQPAAPEPPDARAAGPEPQPVVDVPLPPDPPAAAPVYPAQPTVGVNSAVPVVDLTRPTPPAAEPDPELVDALVDAAGGYQDRPVHLAVMAVRAGIGAIAKSRDNKQQGFKFRGIDDIINALSPALDRVGVLPRLFTEELVELEPRTTKNAGTLNAVRVHVRYDAIGPRGDTMDLGDVWGEGADAADKATSKAYSLAYKTWAVETFSITTENLSDDGDRDSPEGAPRRQDPELIGRINRAAQYLGVYPPDDFAALYPGEKIEDAGPERHREYTEHICARANARQAHAAPSAANGQPNGQPHPTVGAGR